MRVRFLPPPLSLTKQLFTMAPTNNTMSVDGIIEHFTEAMASPSATESTIEIARNTISYLNFLKSVHTNTPWLELQSSLDWKDRLKGEYMQLQDRLKKLRKTLVKIDAGTITFKGKSTIPVLLTQEKHMIDYLHTLEVRMELEGIEY